MLDWIAGILELIGLWKVGDKNWKGFIFNICCGICWILYVFISGNTYGLLVVVIPAILINIRNLIKWKKGDLNHLDQLDQLKKEVAILKNQLEQAKDNIHTGFK